jgi:paraquat-inducible protein A
MRATASALQLGLIACTACGQLSNARADAALGRCPRCGAILHPRKPHSIERTWALLIASAILYIPAMALPVMRTGTLFGTENHTIIGGVVDLWNSGSWDLSVIVFVASVVVPILKMLALGLLAITAQQRSTWRQPQRARLYRMLEAVGHWSMLDIFVVALLVTLVQFGNLAQTRPEPGIIAFGAVVVLTMLASAGFDPRLIWDEKIRDETHG